MLVLSRKEGERIRIGDDIVVMVVRTGGDKVRIGIEAPQTMVVLRDELKSIKDASPIVADVPPAPDSVPFDFVLPTSAVNMSSFP